MKGWLFATLVIGFTLLAIRPPSANADERDKKTEMSFTAPVEIPGLVLPPGTYVFKLADSLWNRGIVQVFNKDETKLYATFLARPDYRRIPASKTILTFKERAAGSPEAIKEWFYPGDNYGEEFVYPRTLAAETAKNITRPAKTAQAPSVVALKNAPVTAVNPQGAEVEIAQAVTPKPAATKQADPAPVQTATPAHSTPRRLPQTASDLSPILLRWNYYACLVLGVDFLEAM